HVRGVDHVLDAERNPVQGAARSGVLELAVERPRLVEGQLRVHEFPRLNVALALGDALQARADEGFAGQLAALEAARGFGGGKRVRGGRGWGRHDLTERAGFAE